MKFDMQQWATKHLFCQIIKMADCSDVLILNILNNNIILVWFCVNPQFKKTLKKQ